MYHQPIIIWDGGGRGVSLCISPLLVVISTKSVSLCLQVSAPDSSNHNNVVLLSSCRLSYHWE